VASISLRTGFSEGTADPANAGVLAAKLLADAAAAEFTLPDMGLDDETAETYIRSAMVRVAEPGTPGD
jgi:hypothetical protein